MATNRIYLKCTCGDKLFLGKRLGLKYWWEYYSDSKYPKLKSLEEKINKFYEEHSTHSIDEFRIEYEMSK